MGDCAFSEWCRRWKASGAGVPGSVCAVCPQTTASTSLDNQESGKRPNRPGSATRQLVAGSWQFVIR
jgi:hypothetical protein